MNTKGTSQFHTARLRSWVCGCAMRSQIDDDVNNTLVSAVARRCVAAFSNIYVLTKVPCLSYPVTPKGLACLSLLQSLTPIKRAFYSILVRKVSIQQGMRSSSSKAFTVTSKSFGTKCQRAIIDLQVSMRRGLSAAHHRVFDTWLTSVVGWLLCF